MITPDKFKPFRLHKAFSTLIAIVNKELLAMARSWFLRYSRAVIRITTSKFITKVLNNVTYVGPTLTIRSCLYIFLSNIKTFDLGSHLLDLDSHPSFSKQWAYCKKDFSAITIRCYCAKISVGHISFFGCNVINIFFYLSHCGWH